MSASKFIYLKGGGVVADSFLCETIGAIINSLYHYLQFEVYYWSILNGGGVVADSHSFTKRLLHIHTYLLLHLKGGGMVAGPFNGKQWTLPYNFSHNLSSR